MLAISIGANLTLGGVLLGMLYGRRGVDAARLTDPEQALAQFRSLDPAARGHATLASDGRAALIELDDGTFGLVERRGRRWAARTLDPRELVGCDAAGEGTIHLRFADFGWPRACVRLEDPATRERWLGRLGARRRSDGDDLPEVHDA